MIHWEGPVTSSPIPYYSTSLQLANLQHGLSKVLPCQHTNQSFSSIFHSLSNTHLDLELALVNPLLHVLLVLDEVFGTHTRVHNNETLHLDALGNNLHQVLDRVCVGWGEVVLGHHAAGDDAAVLLHVGDCGLELFTANLVVPLVLVAWDGGSEANLHSRSRYQFPLEPISAVPRKASPSCS